MVLSGWVRSSGVRCGGVGGVRKRSPLSRTRPGRGRVDQGKALLARERTRKEERRERKLKNGRKDEYHGGMREGEEGVWKMGTMTDFI